MFVKQLYTTCLAQAAYYIESDGIAAIVDPMRDYQEYIDFANERGASIKYVFETHFHADFVSGHIDLAAKTGAQIVYGSKANTGFETKLAEDGEQLSLGKTTIKVLHTPGHTPESVCYLLQDEEGKDHAIFSGDTLFVGDVGRPDLCQAGLNLSKEQMAEYLYESLQSKIVPLNDEVTLYPGHGPGSACGKNLGPETMSTLGKEKKFNYALQFKSKEAFVAAICEGISQPPSYFFEDAALNQKGYKSLNKIMQSAPMLAAADFKKSVAENALIIDTRHPDEFELGFISGAINIGLNGQYAIWAATLYDLDRKMVLVTAKGQEEESIIRLSRVGFSNIVGCLENGMDAWDETIGMVISITPEELALDLKHSDDQVLDVRKESEWETCHLKGAKHLSLENMEEQLDELNKDHKYMVHCAGGYRSMIASSILKKHGFNNIKNVYGGMSKIKELEIDIIYPEKAELG